MNSLISVIKQQKPNIKDITLNNYVRNIKTIIYKYTGKDIFRFNIEYLLDFEDVEKFILFLSNLQVSESTKYTYLFAVITLLSLDKENYKNEIKEYQFLYKQMGESLKKLPKTENEDKQWTTMESLIKKTKDLGKDISTFKKHRNYVIAALHTMQPPRRNIARTLIVTSTKPKKDNNNYLVLGKPYYFIYGNQKARTYNHERIDINKDLQNILKNYIEKYNKSDFYTGNSLLLPTYENNNKELSTGAYTQILKKYLGVSSSMIRKIYISEHKNDEITGMGNSTATQYNYYYKK
jgi:hypothetical protein